MVFNTSLSLHGSLVNLKLSWCKGPNLYCTLNLFAKDVQCSNFESGMPILKTMAHGIVWGSFAKSTIGCGPVFNAPRQQQENPSIHVIHCGLDSKNNIQWDGHVAIWDAESWPSGPVSRCPEETLAWLPKEVCCCLAELSDAVTNSDDNTHLCSHNFFYVVGRDNCAFHAPRGLAVN